MLLDSLAVQSFKDFELIIQDGGSTDSTVTMAASYKDQLPALTLNSAPDSGIYDAWNKALVHAAGKWVLFLGADDYLMDSDSLLLVAEQCENLPGSIQLVSTPVARVTADGFPVETLLPASNPKKALCRGMSLPHSGLFHRRELFENEFFDPSLWIAGDFDFICRALTFENHFFFSTPAVCMTIGGLSGNPANLVSTYRENLRVLRRCLPEENTFVLRKYLLCAKAYKLYNSIFGARGAMRLLDLYRSILRGKVGLWGDSAPNLPEALRLPKKDGRSQDGSPLFSLLIAASGCMGPLQNLLEDIAGQSMRDFEVIIGVQNPAETLNDIVSHFSTKFPLSCVRLSERGVSEARNALISRAKGKYIAFPDDNCRYAADTLKIVSNLFGMLPHVSVLLAEWSTLCELGQPCPSDQERYNRPVTRYGAFHKAEVWRMFCKSDTATAVNGFDPEFGPGDGVRYRAGEDMDFLVRILDAGFKVIRPAELKVFHASLDPADPSLQAKIKICCFARMHLLDKYEMPVWFKLANVVYPLWPVPLEDPKAFRCRWDMFFWQLKYFLRSSRDKVACLLS